jgi:hypothetical protein
LDDITIFIRVVKFSAMGSGGVFVPCGFDREGGATRKCGVYDRNRYDISLNYTADLPTPLGEEDAEWMRGVLAGSSIAEEPS